MPTHFRNCNICEAMCGLEIEYAGDEILSIKGDKKDPFSRGHICPKAVALQDFHKDPDRLRHPVKKTENGFQKISWKEAFDLIELKIKNIQGKYGNDAVATYLGNPNVHNVGNQLFLPNFLRSIKSKNRYSASSVDQLPHHVASKFMFGHSLLLPVPDIDRTNFMLIIGANPLVSNGSMMTSPDFAKRMRAIQERGGKVVVVDPRRTETAEKADQHFFIKPETDALLLLALINEHFENGKINLRHLSESIEGIDEIKKACSHYPASKVAGITGISADEIKALAAEMAAAESAVCYSRMGASTQSFGGLCLWLTNAFNILSGNFDREGGAMFTLPAFDAVQIGSKKGKPERETPLSRVRKLPGYYGEFPVVTLADEIEHEGEGQVKALITVAGNPVLSTPNGNRLEANLAQLEFMVSLDIYINETSRHADVILPAATGLEIPQFDVAFNNLSVRNTAKYSPALFEKPEGVKHDWEILAALTERFSGKKGDGSTPETILDMAIRFGPQGNTGLTMDRLQANPHGIDLGPLTACLAQRLQTNDDKIQLSPAIFLKDLDRLVSTFFGKKTQENQPYPFQLIGRRVLRQHNTWTHNSPRLSKGRNECTLMIHPIDADALSIRKGDMVLVRSRVGEVQLEVNITDEIMPGVVSIPQGFGSRKNTSMVHAATRNGVSINDLTDEMRVDELTGNAALNGVKVAVLRLFPH